MVVVLDISVSFPSFPLSLSFNIADGLCFLFGSYPLQNINLHPDKCTLMVVIL